MKNAHLSMMSLAVLASLLACSASAADEIKALQATIASNSVTRTSKGNRYYLAYYRELCTKEEREAILERNIAAHRRWIALAGENGAKPQQAALPRAELGKVLAIGGRWAEAEKELTEALKSDFDRNRMAEARWALAECLWHRGDKDGAKKIVADIVAVTEKTDKRYGDGSVWEKARFMHRAWTDPDGDVDDLKLPHSIDCKPFPSPQEAKYGEKKVSLARVELKVKGLSDERGASDEGPHASRDPHVSQDPIVRLLKRKLTRFGTKFEKGGTPVGLAIVPNAPVDKPQGYSIDVKDGKVFVVARTRLGLTWGVVSLIQCVERRDERDGGDKRDRPSICEMAIRDWPKLERRGVIEARWKADFLEYALFHKMSSLVIKMGRPECSFMFSELERERVRLTIRRFLDFGIESYWSARELSVHPPLPFSAKRTRDLHLQWFRWAAQFGGNVCFEMDDERFRDGGLPEVDKKVFGTATNMDSKYMTSLYREVKKEFPGFRLIFGTPFYFGPDGGCGKNWYPEERTPYLKSHREFLDPEIDVYWSGPRVKSYSFSANKIQWMTDLIGRKPVIYHNGDAVGHHNHNSYGADIPGYKSHCPETLDMIGAFYVNMTRYHEAPKVGPAMDWCWNPDAHDAEVATRRTLELLEGPGVFEILSPAIPPISYLDKYNGTPRSELFSEDQAKLDKIASDGEKAWRDVLAIAKNGGMFVAGFDINALQNAKKLASLRRNPPKWLRDKVKAEMDNTKFAVAEVGYDEKNGDKFFPAEQLQGGYYNPSATYRMEKDRGSCGVKYVDVGKELSANFSCEQFPPERPPKVFVVGASFHAGVVPEIEIEVNGSIVWRGPAFAKPYYFTPLEVTIPVNTLQRSNRLVVRNVSPVSEPFRKPTIHYAVIKK